MVADQTTPSQIRERVRSVRSSLTFAEAPRGTTGPAEYLTEGHGILGLVRL